jgi:hypothetical protein
MKNILCSLIAVLLLTPALFAGEEKLEISTESHFFASQEPVLFAQNDDLNQNPLLDDDAGDRKSVSRAMLLSLVLPGLGEMYVGRKSRAIGFFAAEAGIWSAFILFKHKQNWLKDDYINFARSHAGVDPEGKSDFFYDMLAFYDNRDDYNAISRAGSRDNPFFPEVPEYDWQWESNEMRRQYRDLKNSSEASKRNANFALGAALANRVISVVDAWWCAKSYNRQFSTFFSRVKLRLSPSLGDLVSGNFSPGIALNYKYSF